MTLCCTLNILFNHAVTLQVFSILYLYLDTNGNTLPFGINRSALEIGMTFALFALNFFVIAMLFLAWIARLAFEKLLATRRKIAAAKGRVGDIEMRVLEAASELHIEHINPIVNGVAAGIPSTCPVASADGEVTRLCERLKDEVSLLKEENADVKDENSLLKEENADVKDKIILLKEEVGMLKAERQGDAVKVAIANPPQGLPPGWAESYTAAGKVYYGNFLTGESSWSKPAQMQSEDYGRCSTHV